MIIKVISRHPGYTNGNFWALSKVEPGCLGRFASLFWWELEADLWGSRRVNKTLPTISLLLSHPRSPFPKTCSTSLVHQSFPWAKSWEPLAAQLGLAVVFNHIAQFLFSLHARVPVAHELCILTAALTGAVQRQAGAGAGEARLSPPTISSIPGLFGYLHGTCLPGWKVTIFFQRVFSQSNDRGLCATSWESLSPHTAPGIKKKKKSREKHTV